MNRLDQTSREYWERAPVALTDPMRIADCLPTVEVTAK